MPAHVLALTLVLLSSTDRDGDGVGDANDACPQEPEDRDGFTDQDGCPDPDNDGDGVADVTDRCPNDPEDRDAWQDEDGCPDVDNDRDGVPDPYDRCPSQAETVDNLQDDDGCPDLSPALIETGVRAAERGIAVPSDALFERGTTTFSRLGMQLLPWLDGVVAGRRVRVDCYADSMGAEAFNQKLTQARAEALRDRLLRITPATTNRRAEMDAYGHGSGSPVADNAGEDGRKLNRRCEITSR